MTNTKKQKVLKITAILLAVLTILTAGIIGICYSAKNNAPSVSTTELHGEPDFEYSEPKVYNMPKAMAFTAKTLAAAQANGQTVDVKIQASVTPWDAANQQVDYSIAWGAAPTHGKEAVTDYVTVTQDSDGSLTATISCKKAFGGDKIIVTVTTRDGGFTANCTVSFVGVASTISITNSSLNPISDTNRGNYYQLGTNKTYNFTVNLGNIFNTIGSKNLTVTLGGVGELYFGDEFVDETIDMVVSVNGIPVIALELKNQFTGQTYENAIVQYKKRDFKEKIFRLNYRFLVYFAVDHYETWMTTVLKGENTYFLPFNQGSNGAGNSGGKGNPANPNGYSTSYLWEKVLTRDFTLDLIRKFVSFVKEKKEVEVNGRTKEITEEKLLFPRYHQFDVVHKVVDDIKTNGAGKNYLIEHSAGSGKSNSIAWISYRLASLFDAENKPVFNSVIVVTNRVVLDSQLQDTINGFDHTPGLVEAIDEKKGSRGIKDAINDKKRIIICTVQKFLFAYKDFDDLSGRNFAVLIDEAHQGQNGKTALALKTGLLDKNKALKEYADEEGVDVDDLTEGDILDNLIAQGKHSNQTFIAFTATPKPKTLEAFGCIDYLQKSVDGKLKFKPFHIYSMKQAIQEGFILDVLQDYLTIKEAFRIVKVTEENPELIEGPAQKALVRYYKEHGYTIGHKTDVIMSNFMQSGIKKINGHAKAMVVADSRHNAVRYYWAIKDYIKSHYAECHNVGVLVAFSGTVKFDDDPDNEYTESNLNIDADGHSINTDKKFRKAIKSNKYQIMIVADKYQTGFDEPLLHSMYVDKKLAGVNAVQTLSRLNRTTRGKEDTFVLDFVNTEGEIKKAFSQFYEDTVLDGITDYNQVYDIRTKINEYMLYDFAVVDEFYNIMSSQSGKKQTGTTSGKLSSLLKSVVDKYIELDKGKQFLYRGLIKKFNKAYSFIAQLVRIHDEELFKEYLFTSHLISYLPAEKTNKYLLDDKIRLEFESLKESFRGSIQLEKNGEFKPGNSTDAPVRKKKKDTLERIIEKVNDKYNGEFTDSDRVIISGILNMFMNDTEIKKYQRYALSNDSEMFINSLFPEKFMEIVAKCFLENNDTFKKLYEDSDFKQKVMQAMGKELYSELRKKKDNEQR